MAIMIQDKYWHPEAHGRVCPPEYHPRICGCVRRAGRLTVWPGPPSIGMGGIYAIDDTPAARGWCEANSLAYTADYFVGCVSAI